MTPTFLAAGLLALALSATACGVAEQPALEPVADPGAGTCLEGTPDCDDTAGDDEPVDDTFDTEAARASAEALLGLTDEDLDADVRIGRRGEEMMMLTEDYRLGRMTVELDIDDMDRWIVTAVTVELPDGPETFTRYLE